MIAERLSEAAQLAGWIGFFRWAIETELDGVEDVRGSLARDGVTVRTPRRIAYQERAAWISGAGAKPPAEIPDWMREHRARELARQGSVPGGE